MGGGKWKEKERCGPRQRRDIASWLRFSRDSVQSALAESAIRSAVEVGTSEVKPLNRNRTKLGMRISEIIKLMASLSRD